MATQDTGETIERIVDCVAPQDTGETIERIVDCVTTQDTGETVYSTWYMLLSSLLKSECFTSLWFLAREEREMSFRLRRRCVCGIHTSL